MIVPNMMGKIIHSCSKPPTNKMLTFLYWLVVSTYSSEKYEFVSWDDDIPNIWKNSKSCSKAPISILLMVWHNVSWMSEKKGIEAQISATYWFQGFWDLESSAVWSQNSWIVCSRYALFQTKHHWPRNWWGVLMLERRGYRDINNKEGDAPKFSGKKRTGTKQKTCCATSILPYGVTSTLRCVPSGNQAWQLNVSIYSQFSS